MPSLKSEIARSLQNGMVIAAHPLALNEDRRLDERHQRALTHYYLAAGVGGLAVGVHTTQFRIHDPKVGLLRPVLELAIEVAGDADVVMVGGAIGSTSQAVAETELLSALGYDLVLLSPGDLGDVKEEAILERTRAVGEVLPVFGFYLQPAVGGRRLSYDFWRQMAEIEAVVAIKMAPFDRYATGEVVRAIADSGRAGQIALYTGNDDSIVVDLMTTFDLGRGEPLRVVGGLLGQWAIWTSTAVDLFRRVTAAGPDEAGDLLRLGAQLTDANAAVFDAANRFRGCVPGINEVLRRQGLLATNLCIDPAETLSAGQTEEISRVHDCYSWLPDDDFVRAHLDEWLG